jgi:hypothetical protein
MSLRIKCGEGKIAVHDGLLDGVPCLSIGNNGKGEVGLPVEGGEMPEDIELMVVTFTNQPSVDVWIKHLTNIRNSFLDSTVA